MVGLQTLDRCAPLIICRSAALERPARACRRAPTGSARRRPSSSSGRRRSRRCRASPPRAPSSCAGAVSAGPGCTSCTCCCALSHGSTWQLPIYGAERDGEWIDTLAAVTHTATRYMASGDCALRGDARGEQVLRGALDAMPRAARADDRRARHPPNIAAPLDERSAGHTDHAPRASSRVGAIESTAATCCRATTHSSTCSWLSSRRRLRRPSRSTKTVRCFTVQPATTATSLGYSPAARIATNASTTGFSLCAHERVGASAMRRESADLAAALESGHVPSP